MEKLQVLMWKQKNISNSRRKRLLQGGGGYSVKHAFKMNEMDLFWKNTSERPYKTKGKKSAPGFKVAEGHISLVIMTYVGDLKLMPFAIYPLETSKAFRGCVKEELGVEWRSNHMGWMTSITHHNYMVCLPQYPPKSLPTGGGQYPSHLKATED